MENKNEIVKKLERLLQETRMYRDLESLRYVTLEDCSERVVAVFADGRIRRVDVTADSGISLICDVLRNI